MLTHSLSVSFLPGIPNCELDIWLCRLDGSRCLFYGIVDDSLGIFFRLQMHWTGKSQSFAAPSLTNLCISHCSA
jgi:hypothetical protein